MAAFSSNETDVLERSADVSSGVDSASLQQVWNDHKLEEIISWADSNNLKRICLQFPDDLLQYSVGICAELQEKASDREFFILADTTYCPCCVDEVGAEHVSANGLVHFGPACLTKPQSDVLKVIYMFTEDSLDANAFKEAVENAFPDKSSFLGIFYSTAMAHQLEHIRMAVTSYPNACVATLAVHDDADVLHFNTPGVKDFSSYSCIYIGQDDQCLFNVSVSVNATQWLLYDYQKDSLRGAPLAASAWLRRRMFHVEKCKDAQTIGIVHGTVSTKGHLEMSQRIQTLAKSHNIRTMLISVGKLNPAKLANFMEIDCFVLIGCPQNNMYTSREFYKPLVSAFECELALNPAWREKLPATYSTDFKELLVNGKQYTEIDANAVHESDISLLTGGVRGGVVRADQQKPNESTDLMSKSDNVIAERTAGDALRERTWRGLEQNLGQDEVAEIQPGRSGLAIRYEENPIE